MKWESAIAIFLHSSLLMLEVLAYQEKWCIFCVGVARRRHRQPKLQCHL
ncbi:hypothetical protein [Nostoc sp.]